MHPQASYRLAVAIRYWHSARILLEYQIRDVEFAEPVGFLLSMATELTLKAYLLDKNFSDKALSSKKVGHDLRILLRLCIANGFQISEPDADGVQVLRTGHIAHYNRYGPEWNLPATIELADEKKSLALVARLIDLVAQDPTKLRKRHMRSPDLDWPWTLPLHGGISLEQLDLVERHAQARADKIAAIGLKIRQKQ